MLLTIKCQGAFCGNLLMILKPYSRYQTILIIKAVIPTNATHPPPIWIKLGLATPQINDINASTCKIQNKIKIKGMWFTFLYSILFAICVFQFVLSKNIHMMQTRYINLHKDAGNYFYHKTKSSWRLRDVSEISA